MTKNNIVSLWIETKNDTQNFYYDNEIDRIVFKVVRNSKKPKLIKKMKENNYNNLWLAFVNLKAKKGFVFKNLIDFEDTEE